MGAKLRLARHPENRTLQPVQLSFLGLKLPEQYPEDWVVQCKAVGSGQKVLVYLGRYLYRGVLPEKNIVSNHKTKGHPLCFSHLACETKWVSFYFGWGCTTVRLVVKLSAKDKGAAMPNARADAMAKKNLPDWGLSMKSSLVKNYREKAIFTAKDAKEWHGLFSASFAPACKTNISIFALRVDNCQVIFFQDVRHHRGFPAAS